MGKKKNLKGLDEFDLEIINEKLGKSVTDYINPDDIVSATSLKALSYKIDIKCKNEKQKEFLKNLKDKNHQICFASGAAGAGKSYISLAYALSALKDGGNSFDKIIIVIPTCPAGNMDIGLLKGTYEDKIRPYLEADTYTMEKIMKNSGNGMPIDNVRTLISHGYIDYQLVNFARGKTFDNCIVLINEAENYSREEMLLLLTRMGENSKFIISGDPIQKDRKDLKKNGDGLTYAIERLKNLEETCVTIFTNDDIVRNPLITKVLENWN
jgi:phosphate starvation-inducible PhoH-like protein